EGGKLVAIACEQRCARRLLGHEDPCHRGEELFAGDPPDDWETALYRPHQTRDYVIAVDGEAPGRKYRIRRSDAAGDRLADVEQRVCKRCFKRHGHDVPS